MPLVLTCDTEWSSEEDIQALFALADSYAVPLFPFVTHRSAFLLKRDGPQGIHPNFLPGSTHGCTEEEVIRHCFFLVPGATAFRSHCFFSHTRMLWALADRGITVDANLLTYLNYREPFRNVGGFTTYPTFWSDDVALRNGDIVDPNRFQTRKALVCNVHPKNWREPVVEQVFALAQNNAVPFESLPR